VAGILDWFGDPANQGLLNLSAGLLQASGPSLKPVSFGQALGQGMQQGMQGFQQAQQMNQQQQLFDLKKAEMARQANAPISMGPGSVLLDPITKQPVFQASFAPRAEPEVKAPQTRKVRIGNEEVTQEFNPQTMQWSEVGRGPAFSDKPLVTIGGEQQESAFQKRLGQEMGDQYANLLKADMNAPATIGKYERLSGLLSSVNTGKFKGATTDLKAAAKSLGIDLNALGVTDDVAPAQAARALSNQIALELRNPAGGAGMPGALSDKDREFLIASIPGLENDPAAIGKMIEYRVKLARREQEVAKKARAYRKKNGRFDEGFYDELQEWSDKNPLFPAAKSQAPAPATEGPKQGDVVDGYEFLGGDPANQASWRKK
jgi:hypothetical protein